MDTRSHAHIQLVPREEARGSATGRAVARKATVVTLKHQYYCIRVGCGESPQHPCLFLVDIMRNIGFADKCPLLQQVPTAQYFACATTSMVASRSSAKEGATFLRATIAKRSCSKAQVVHVRDNWVWQFLGRAGLQNNI